MARNLTQMGLVTVISLPVNSSRPVSRSIRKTTTLLLLAFPATRQVPVGAMGLPLALLAIGASLKWEQSKQHLGALSWTVGCKLILLPLITLSLIRMFLPDADPVSLGTAVILAATPSAVACYVISCQLGIEKAFVATMLVVSTGLSALTIPVWVYLIKGM